MTQMKIRNSSKNCGFYIIVEGPDGAGKTTLVNALDDVMRIASLYPVVRYHYGELPNLSGPQLARIYRDSMTIPGIGVGDVICDRSWISEEPYRRVYRPDLRRLNPEIDRRLARAAARCSSAIILCLPDFYRIAENFKNRMGEEYLDDMDQLSLVYKWYRHNVVPAFFHLPVVVVDPFERTYNVIRPDRDDFDPRSYVNIEEFWYEGIAPNVTLAHEVNEASDWSCGYANAKVAVFMHRLREMSYLDHHPVMNLPGADAQCELSMRMSLASIPESLVSWHWVADDSSGYALEKMRDRVEHFGVRVAAVGECASRILSKHNVKHTSFEDSFKTIGSVNPSFSDFVYGADMDKE